MPPPPSFLDITPIPFSRTITQAEFNAGTFGGTANTLWCRFVTATKIVFGGVTNKGGTFVPTTHIFASDGTTLLWTIDHATNFFAWHFLFAAGTYYVQITRHGAGATDFDFSVAFDTRAILTSLTPGYLIINDDTQNFPAIVMDTSGNSLGFLDIIPSGEIADGLATGEQLWHDRFGLQAANQVSAFTATPTYIGSVDTVPPLGGAQFPRITHDNTRFYIANPFTGDIFPVSAVGVRGAQIASCFDLQGNSIIGVNRAGTVLYNGDQTGASSGVIRRWDLVNDVALSNLCTLPDFDVGADLFGQTAEGEPGEILSMANDDVICWWFDNTANEWVLVTIDVTGVVLHQFRYSGVDRLIDHVHYFTDDAHLRIWFFTDFALTRAKYAEVKRSDGSITADFDTDVFTAGINRVANSVTIFGPAESCGLVTYAYGLAPPAPPFEGSEIICLHGSAQGTLGLAGSYVRAIGRVVQ